MNEIIILSNEEKKEVVERFRREQAELEKFYEEVIKNLKLNLERKKKNN